MQVPDLCGANSKRRKLYKVIGVARISTDNQDELSLADQEAYYRKWLDNEYGVGNYELHVIAYQGSGQVIDTAEFLGLCEKVDSGEYDLVIAEDLSRICRRMQAVTFCENAADTDTRVVGIGDHVDTAQEGWETGAVFASLKNSTFCKDTSRRIIRSLRNRFDNGGIFQHEIWGYYKPEGKSHEDDIAKLQEAEQIYDQWFTMLEGDENGNGACSFAEVADWLNSLGVPTGKHCKKDTWDGTMVGRYTRNPLLKGERRRNDRVAKRVNRTGRTKTVPAPEGHALSRHCPHLQFIEPERYDRVLRKIAKRNAKYKRSESKATDPRNGISRLDTAWPGQHLVCGVCGRRFLFGGHGRKERMMCAGARDYRCWNSMTVSGPDIASAVSQDLQALIQNLPDFDEMWAREFASQRDAHSTKQNSELDKYSKLLDAENRKLENLTNGLAELGSSEVVIAKIRETEGQVNELRDKISDIKSRQQGPVTLPTMEEIQRVSAEAFTDLAVGSKEFARLLRSIISDFFVLPYRLADGGHVQPRLTYKVSLGKLISPRHDLPIVQFDRKLDLTDCPKRLRFLEEVVRMVGNGQKHQDVADELGIFKTEVGYAMRLQRCMTELGTSDPWVPVTSLEQVTGCYKRVHNHRFKFEPLSGFEKTKHPDLS